MSSLKHIINKYTLFLLSTILLYSCGQTGSTVSDEQLDTPKKGRIVVSADESFKPIVDELKKVFEANTPGTEIAITYKPEAECLKDFFTDSVRLIITTRKYSAQERQEIVDSFKLSPKDMVVAQDAVAVIVNPKSGDSLFTMKELKEILTGRSEKKLIPVFDGLKATSTIQYVLDSVLRGDSLGANVRAAASSEKVIDYVAATPNAIGFIGVSWVGNKEDSLQISFSKRIKMAHIESTDHPGGYVLPVQANIYLKRYPMVRNLVYMYKERHRGLGKGFADFISGELGQLIFKRAFLMPAQKNFNIRPIRLNYVD